MQYTRISENDRAWVLRLETNKLNTCSVARAINKKLFDLAAEENDQCKDNVLVATQTKIKIKV